MSERAHTLALIAAVVLAAPAARAGGLLADPTRPPDHSAPAKRTQVSASQWRLHSTLVASGRRLAIVNGRLVGAGDRVDEARVVAIDAGRVTLVASGRRIVLRLLPRDTKEAKP